MEKLKKILASACLSVFAAVPAMAATDYAGMVSAVTDEITPAVTAALPIAGTVLAIGVGVKLFKRFVK